MATDDHRLGRKPKRLYARVARFLPDRAVEGPAPAAVRAFVGELDRNGRLVAHGSLTRPDGDLLIFRAEDRAQADRLLRVDPFRPVEGSVYEVLEWKATDAGTGVNLEPPPARGSGRLTLLQRVAVVVRDQAAAVDWYRNVLGLEVVAQDPETQHVELALGRGAVALSLIAPRPAWGEPYYSEAMARLGTPTGIIFQTDSVDAFELRLRHAGASVTRPIERQPWGGRTIRFTDPDGNEFLAYERDAPPRPRSATGAISTVVARRAEAV